MSTKINARVVADSINSRGDRLTSFILTYPHIIHSELLTHRAFTSKNTSSSRAIPFKKVVETVQNNPFIPIAWQKEHKGMQGNEYWEKEIDIEANKIRWNAAKEKAIKSAISLNEMGVTKQLCNRLLEPWMWTTMLITGSKYAFDNFFSLRCPEYVIGNYNDYDERIGEEVFKSRKDASKGNRYFHLNDVETQKEGSWSENMTELDWLYLNKGQAEIHLMYLAEKMYDSYYESKPKELSGGQWHIPFEDKIDINYCRELVLKDLEAKGEYYYELEEGKWDNEINLKKVQISCGMAARVSYTTVGNEKELSYDKLTDIHDKCLNSRHYSVLEHCCRSMSKEEYETYISGRIDLEGIIKDKENKNFNTKGWCRQTKGFIPYRYLIENQLKLVKY